MKKEELFLGLVRIGLGLIFLWAFFDKLFGLGFATTPDKSWLAGSSPTYGFLSNAVHGPFVSFYHAIAGSVLVDVLFMAGLLLIGLALTFGVFVRLGCYAGALLMFLMWTALLPPANHPFIDDHVIYALVLLFMSFANAGDYIGFGKSWGKCKFVKNCKILK